MLRNVTPPQVIPAVTQMDESTRALAVKLAHLARIDLPNFDGDWLNWPNLKSMFESLVHEDDTIPPRVKLQYLKAHLTGPAAAHVENVHVSDEGYDGAWADLLKAYDNPSLIYFNYMRSVAECPPASKSSPKSHAAVLLIRDVHAHVLHGGPQLTRNYLQQRFWILRGNGFIRKIIRSCVRCTRFSGISIQQVMGVLPKERVSRTLPFQQSGVEYAGPIMVKAKRGRGFVSYKAYICLFICLSTRAIHLELVTDLTSNAFVAAFQRFVSRRGLCSLLLSDTDTTFKGADKELRDLFQAASSFYSESTTELASQGVEWRFIPPYAPNFGGLWEAGVKSAKFHLRRVVGEQLFTYEEFSTLLTLVEACLNSRPLTPLSDDPTDPEALTPGHFLIGRPLLAVPEPKHSAPSCVRSMWRTISNLRNDFWHRWSSEYLHSLQALPKWRKERSRLREGDTVLVVDQLLPPTKWPLGRVVHVHRGPDGHVRVADIRTAKGVVMRVLSKICWLPCSPAIERKPTSDEDNR